MTASDTQKILEVQGISKTFEGKRPLPWIEPYRVTAVQDVSFDLFRGKTLGVVGESGCGKSTLARCVLNLIKPTQGTIKYNGDDVTDASAKKWRYLRGQIQIIFQDPYSSLNPRKTIGQALAEPLFVHKRIRYKGALEYIRKVLDEVGLPNNAIDKYPHEFSGGQRQRVAIARALILEPELIVADEAVSALDVSVQAQILLLLNRIQKERNLSYLFITHDLGVVRNFCDDVLVMYLGRVVEMGQVDSILDNPQHPYTRSLRDASPIPDVSARQKLTLLEGEIPSPANPPSGCAFHPRCESKTEICSQKLPPVSVRNNSMCACFNPLSATS